MVASLLIGGLLLALTLFKYIQTRKEVKPNSQNVHSSLKTSTNPQPDAPSNKVLRIQKSNDRWIVIRFSIAFTALAQVFSFLPYLTFPWELIARLKETRINSRLEYSKLPPYSSKSSNTARVNPPPLIERRRPVSG